MRRMSVVVLVAACSSSTSSDPVVADPDAPVDAAPHANVMSYDVLVTSDYVKLVPTIDMPDCLTHQAFPPVGTCGYRTDVVAEACRPASNTTAAIGGTAPSFVDDGAFYFGAIAAGQTLVLDAPSDARHAEIALGAHVFPDVTNVAATFHRDPQSCDSCGTLDVSWTTDGDSALVDFTDPHTPICHAAGSATSIANVPLPPKVIGLLGPDVHDSPFGQIRVWHGTMVAAPPNP